MDINQPQEPQPLASLAADGTPVVRFNVVRHPTEVLVKRLRLEADNVTKTAGGRIPKGCTVTTITSSLAEYVRIVHDGGTRQYALPSNADIGDGVPLSVKGVVADGSVNRGAE